jgi:CRISPR system Cascade subunit CasC
MKNNRLYVDFHVIQTVPPSCVNRDDTGSPKTAQYGGVTRARVSSQAWKHAMREEFKELFEDIDIGIRTKKAVQMMAKKILEKSDVSPETAEEMARDALKHAMTVKKNGKEQELELEKDKKTLKALAFFSEEQAEALAELAKDGEEDKAKYKSALKQNPSYDMALFGRMVASDPSLNYDAAAQVAHSISTHGVHNEFDYFTAVDDRQVEDNAGAAHVGSMEFNSSTLYRYATVNVRELEQSLGGDTPAVVRGFAEAFICSMPTGKQNSFANRTLPSLVYVTIRQDQPINLVDAFEKPVVSQTGYTKPSEERLVRRAQQVYQQFDLEPVLAFGIGEGIAELAEPTSLRQLLNGLEASITQQLSEREVNQ